MRHLTRAKIPGTLAGSLISLVIIIYIAYVMKEVIVPLIFSALLSFLLYPVCNWLERRRIPRILAIIVSIVILVAVFVVLSYGIYSQIITLDSLVPVFEQKINLWLDNLGSFLEKNLKIDEKAIIAEAQNYVSDAVKTGSMIIGVTISGTSTFLINLALTPLYVFLMLLYSDFLHNFLYKWLKDTSKVKITATVNKIKSVIRSYVSGLFLVIIIVGTLNTLSLMLIGIEHAVFFGFFAAILVIIPYIGVAIGSALPIIVALITKDSYLAAVAVAASFALIQFLEGNFITPYIVGNQVSINALVAIISLTLFGNLWGISGMILALPLTAIIKVIFDSSDRLRAWGYLLGGAES